MLYYIAASPLVKIFLPEWHERLYQNPDLLSDYETPFEFVIQTGSGGVRIKFNTPQQVEARTQPEAQTLFNWLTGGENGQLCRETDNYGVVVFDPKINVLETFDALAQLDDFVSSDPKKVALARKKREALAQESEKKMRDAKMEVRKRSEERIKRAIKMNHNNLMKQWQLNDEMKLGRYAPSMSELMGAEALAAEIKAASDRTAKVVGRFNDLMNQNQVR